MCVCVCDAILQLVQTRLVDSHVFLTLEMDGNLDTYYERRKTVLQVHSYNIVYYQYVCVVCVFRDWNILNYNYASKAEAKIQWKKFQNMDIHCLQNRL